MRLFSSFCSTHSACHWRAHRSPSFVFSHRQEETTRPSSGTPPPDAPGPRCQRYHVVCLGWACYYCSTAQAGRVGRWNRMNEDPKKIIDIGGWSCEVGLYIACFMLECTLLPCWRLFAIYVVSYGNSAVHCLCCSVLNYFVSIIIVV